ncbi:hypothetical protein F2Q68_00038135 [Brassica cretica]|uniref:Trafficking protein particle complex subunit 2-like protein n=1 Tax=Brassica cretica TaxID=69181 RepID=A0A8S9H742_BRACR|nr:hypothetical protein F2Q68_00038135 [Brassica cretica]
MIVCVAVVGHQNNPLYIQSFTEAEDALKLHHIVHCSLDVIDERVNNPSKSGTTLNEAFLGLLYPALNYKVKFHAAYVDAVSNPFHVPGKKITSRTFSESVTNIVTSYSFN